MVVVVVVVVVVVCVCVCVCVCVYECVCKPKLSQASIACTRPQQYFTFLLAREISQILI